MDSSDSNNHQHHLGSSYHHLYYNTANSAGVPLTSPSSASHQHQLQQQQQHARAGQLYPATSSPTTTTNASWQQQLQQPQIPFPHPQSHSSPPIHSKRTTRASAAAAGGYPNIVPAIKRERVDSTPTLGSPTSASMNTRGDSKEGVGASSSSASHHHDDPMPSTSDFVKKLYKMLEDPNFQSVVSWGPQGDCFVVKDMNEFTKSILPRMFKHSNFASFVRQLNKYDFHKVKNTDDNQFGEHSWTFRHPDFHADRRDALENIKRKVPAQRKSLASQQAVVAAQGGNPLLAPGAAPYPPTGVSAVGGGAGYLSPTASAELQHEIRRLKDDNEDLKGRLRSLERNYESVLVEMVGFQRGMAQQDGVMQSLIAYFLGSESGKSSNNLSSLSSLLVPPPRSTPTSSSPSSTSFGGVSAGVVGGGAMDVDPRSGVVGGGVPPYQPQSSRSGYVSY
ncbi:hypothetical protein EST38_g2042 [Candolleomyces aberdarensis]|uniref:HSF-type DNA-binding domain-containing protein n=1 Tax=Candolleomyces aberdarensis TaxID=2316362 RepID=A0A4Q2DTW2_9AGAR|nr:hypothetical protein EST38_g2042 [Candolleomyces aberdarensis]